MKLRFLSVLLGVFCSFGVLRAQISENFDGNALSSTWKGDVSKFEIEDGKLVLSDDGNAGTSFISTYSTAMDDCLWETTVRLGFKPSGSNFVRIYLTSNSIDFTEPMEGYYLQIGNADRKVLLYQMKNKTAKKLAESEENRLDNETIELSVKVIRNKDSEWKVYTQLNEEKSFREEFSVVDSSFRTTAFSGIYCKYTKTNSTKISVDKFVIDGEAVADETNAAILNTQISDTLIAVAFSEWVDEDYLDYEVSPQIDFHASWNPSHTQLNLRLNEELKQGTKYELSLSDIRDFAGNRSNDTIIPFAKVEQAEEGDILFTEVLFNPNKEGSEFVEIYNASEKVFDLSSLKFSTRKSADSSLYSSKLISNTPLLLFPGELKVLTASQEGVTNFYQSKEENFVVMKSFPSLRNETGAIVLFRAKDSLIIDNFYYESSMHEESIENDGKGVSLERIYLDENKWSSAASVNGYATPGYWSKGGDNAHSSGIEITSSEICRPYYNGVDRFSIKYHFDQPNYQMIAKVYSIDGQYIRSLAENETLDIQGEIAWDGTNQNGKALHPAPYIIRIEAFHSSSGKRFGKSFVVLVTHP